MQRLCGSGIVVPDADCLRAMALAFSRLKLVLEPGGAIALAAALFHGDQIEGDTVIVVASGGNVDPRAIRGYAATSRVKMYEMYNSTPKDVRDCGKQILKCPVPPRSDAHSPA